MAENPIAHPRARDGETGEESALAHTLAQKADRLKYVILAAVALLVAVAAVVLYTGNSRAKQRASESDAVFRAFAQLQGKTAAEAAPILAATAKQFAGQPAGIPAAVQALGVSMDAKQYAEAETVGKAFLADYPDSPLVPRFRVSIAQAQLQLGKAAEAVEGLRSLVPVAGPEILPEAKLALAQALELRAEEAKENPDEYRRRLEEAQAEYTDIASRARLASPAQRGFWPQIVTLTADYALVQIKDRLAGHELPAPTGGAAALDAAVTPAELEALEALRPPAEAAAEENAAEENPEKAPENAAPAQPETPAPAEEHS